MKYKLIKDKNGIPIHSSPPVTPWCPAIYQNDDGNFIFVGKSLNKEVLNNDELRIAQNESAIIVSKDHMKRLIEAYLNGVVKI